MKFINFFLYFCGSFLPSLYPDPIRIWMRIWLHNTDADDQLMIFKCFWCITQVRDCVDDAWRVQDPGGGHLSGEEFMASGQCFQCCGTVPVTIFYGSGSGSDFWKVMAPVPVPTFEKVMVPVPTFEKLRFRFRFRFQLHIYTIKS